MSLVSPGERLGMQLNILQYTDQPPTMKNYSAPRVNNTFSNSHLK